VLDGVEQQRDIAEMMNKPKGTVSKWAAKARREVRIGGNSSTDLDGPGGNPRETMCGAMESTRKLSGKLTCQTRIARWKLRGREYCPSAQIRRSTGKIADVQTNCLKPFVYPSASRSHVEVCMGRAICPERSSSPPGVLKSVRKMRLS
jgi:hypothetical protein